MRGVIKLKSVLLFVLLFFFFFFSPFSSRTVSQLYIIDWSSPAGSLCHFSFLVVFVFFFWGEVINEIENRRICQ